MGRHGTGFAGTNRAEGPPAGPYTSLAFRGPPPCVDARPADLARRSSKTLRGHTVLGHGSFVDPPRLGGLRLGDTSLGRRVWCANEKRNTDHDRCRASNYREPRSAPWLRAILPADIDPREA
ncbi:hypothetical protein VDGL01_11197 [Verticillium dahliae]